MVTTDICWDFSGHWLIQWCNQPAMQLLWPSCVEAYSIKAYFASVDNRIEHLQLEKDKLALIFYDVAFVQDVAIRWQSTLRYFGFYFDLSDAPVLEQTSPVSAKDHYFISYGSSSTSPVFKASAGQRFKGLSVMISEDMLYELLDQFNDSDIEKYRLQLRWDDFLGITTMNKKIVQILLDIQPPEDAEKLVLEKVYLKGNVYRLLSIFLIHLVNRHNASYREASPDYKQVMMLDKMIVSNGLRSIPTIENAASEVYMSPSKFKGAFKEVFGDNYYHYYKELRLQQARSLLMDRTLTIKGIAYGLGYASADSFCKAFTQRFGAKPGSLLPERKRFR
jgi:AraC-like DNA-binding protein